MKEKVFFLIIIVLSIISCYKNNENIESSINGNYTGIFEREGNTSDVELIFNNGTWSG